MDTNPRRVSSLFTMVPALLFTALVLFLSLLYNQGGLTVFCLLLLGIAGGLRLWGALSPRRVKCTPGLDRDRVFAGEEIALAVSVLNRKVLPVWLDIEVPVNGISGSAGGPVLSASGGALWYQGLHHEWNLKAGQRGVYEIGPLRLGSADLPGFFPKEKEVWGPVEVVVYPKLTSLENVNLPQRDLFGTAGGPSPVKDPLFILGTTDYVQGRPARHIHWKASARHHRIQEKLFESSRQEKVLIVVDVEGFEENRQSFERTLEMAASLAVRLEGKGVSTGFLTNGRRKGDTTPFLSVTRSAEQVPAILETLARLMPQPETGVEAMITGGLSLPWGASSYYFAYRDGLPARMAGECLRRRRIPVVFYFAGNLPCEDEDRSVIPGSAGGQRNTGPEVPARP